MAIVAGAMTLTERFSISSPRYGGPTTLDVNKPFAEGRRRVPPKG